MKKVAIFVDADWETIPEYTTIKKVQIVSNDIHGKNYKGFRHFSFDKEQHIVSLIKNPIETNEEIYKIFFYSSMPISLKEKLEILEDTASMATECIEYEMKNPKALKSFKNITDKYLKIYLQNYKQKYCDEFENIEKAIKNIRNNHEFLKSQDYFNMRLCQQEINFKCLCPNGILLLEQRTHKWNNMLAFGLDVALVSYKHLVDVIIVFSRNIDIIPALQCAKNNDLRVRLVGIKEAEETNKETIEKLKEYADEYREINLDDVIDRGTSGVMML